MRFNDDGIPIPSSKNKKTNNLIRKTQHLNWTWRQQHNRLAIWHFCVWKTAYRYKENSVTPTLAALTQASLACDILYTKDAHFLTINEFSVELFCFAFLFTLLQSYLTIFHISSSYYWFHHNISHINFSTGFRCIFKRQTQWYHYYSSWCHWFIACVLIITDASYSVLCTPFAGVCMRNCFHFLCVIKMEIHLT